MNYKLGTKSLSNLVGVHPLLEITVVRAIRCCRVDFSVVEGVRTLDRQRKLVADGHSWTLDSYHLARQVPRYEEQFGLAVDLYPWVNGKTNHHGKHYKYIARAMFKASQELGIVVEWGGLWRNKEDKPHWQIILPEI